MRLYITIAAATLLVAGCGGADKAQNGQSANASAKGNSSAAADPDAGAAAALAEFDGVCRGLDDVDALRTAAQSAGWQEYEPESGSDLDKMLVLGRKAVEEGVPGSTYNNWSYRKSAGGRDLTLVVTDIPEGPAATTECRVYDFAASAPPTQAAVDRWTQVKPSRQISQQGLTAWEWAPGFRDGMTQMSVLHLDAASPLRQQIPAVGLGIVAMKSAAVPSEAQ
jgi:hypothetical protein